MRLNPTPCCLPPRHNLADVHAEIKTGKYVQEWHYDGLYFYPLDLEVVPKIGASIGVAGGGSAGSLRLLVETIGSRYALACRHLVSSEPWDAISQTDKPKIVIMQPAEQDLGKAEASIDKFMEETRLKCKKYDEEKSRSDQGEASTMPQSEGHENSMRQVSLDSCR
jgi:hypothetical protein